MKVVKITRKEHRRILSIVKVRGITKTEAIAIVRNGEEKTKKKLGTS